MTNPELEKYANNANELVSQAGAAQAEREFVRFDPIETFSTEGALQPVSRHFNQLRITSTLVKLREVSQSARLV